MKKKQDPFVRALDTAQEGGSSVVGLLSVEDIVARADSELGAGGGLIEFARQHNVQFEDVEFMTGGEFKEFAQRLFGNRFTTWGCHTDYATYGIIARSRG